LQSALVSILYCFEPPILNTNRPPREKLQNCPKAQTGEFDLDGLCSELTKKAKCSGTGPVVGETDFDTILKKYMGKEVSSNCVAQELGIEINPDHKVHGMPSV
jgi:AP-1-like transcription factor